MNKWFQKRVQAYMYRINFDQYWKRRLAIQNHGESIMCKYYILWLKRQESKFGATTGIGMGTESSPCTQFQERICFPHGLSGIVIARNVCFEGKAVVYQHVTIAEADKRKQTCIGTGVEIGAGAVILNNVRIGDNAKVGANAVVTHDVPDNCVVAGIPAKIIKQVENQEV